MCYLLFSSGSGLPKENIIHIPHSDKLVHATMFAILTIVFKFDLKDAKNSEKKLLASIIAIFCFGCLSEYIQYAFIPSRTGNIMDLIADIAGILIGLISYKHILKIFNKISGNKLTVRTRNAQN